MRKWRLILLLLIIAGWIYRRKFHYNVNNADNQPSAIDRIIGVTETWSNVTWQTDINTDSNADGSLQYAGGGEYADYSEEAAKNAVESGKRVILVFEKDTDPTSVALHEDILLREARIPYNTVIFFVDMQNETALANRLQVQYENTIIYIGQNWQEIRRSWNGVVSLAQIVNGIDGLTSQ